jgi:hypothetical protein
MDHRYIFESYDGGRGRHTCPKCGHHKEFVRYIDTQTGLYLADHVGRCNREVKCGYHYPPSQFFADNPMAQTKLPVPEVRQKITKRPKIGRVKKIDFIPSEIVGRSLVFNGRNSFDKYLFSLFPLEEVHRLMNRYYIGTWTNSRTVFWQIDSQHRVRTGKVIQYDPLTGKRNKRLRVSWVHAELKRRGQLPENFSLEQSLFGEHLLASEPNKPVAVVESEKTAVVASLFMRDFIWLATGGANNLRPARLANLMKGRRVVLYPDSSKFEAWSAKVEEGRRVFGVDVRISDLLERRLTSEEKREDYDIADFLLEEMRNSK